MSEEEVIESSETVERPEYVAERFWNAETNEADYESMGKSYNELNSKFGGFTGAPKDGYAPFEGYEEGDEMVNAFTEWARNGNMSQDMLNDGFKILAAQTGVNTEVTVENELAKMGDNAQKRLDKVDGYLRNNLPSDRYDKYTELTKTALGVEFLEEFMVDTAQPKLSTGGDMGGAGLTRAEVDKEAFKKDEHGNYLRSVDPAYDKKIMEMYAKIV